ncbi:MAG: hypothetical protein Faunusvirus29_4 [Faunusvirus sp.]|jgi:hypothetical protein|uniref:Uncharacterized protein n=1 Tax=Faunusvirus sp. TaxID=2487766 RepID=A0A3G4ZXI4_9VIRU|nr:MAG: hypothetical protein Faunusvirus29_4 [Faunusvirus sp.]
MGNCKSSNRHAEHFHNLINIDPIDETVCIEYINRHNDFYNIQMGIFKTNALTRCIICNASDNLIMQLIERGTDINISDNFGYSPLSNAVLYGRYNIVVHLIAAGAKINQDRCLLSDALRLNRLKIAKYLIDKGVDFDMLCYNMFFMSYEEFYKSYQQQYTIYPEVVDYIKSCYKQSIHNTINDKSADNVMAGCFATTYVPQLVDVICDFII